MGGTDSETNSLASYTIVGKDDGLDANKHYNNSGNIVEGQSNQIVDYTTEDELEGYLDVEDDDGEIYKITSTSTVESRRNSTQEKAPVIPNESRLNAVEYLMGSLNAAMDSLQFDRSLVIQSKMAGNINNSTNEVLKTIDELQMALQEHVKKYDLLKREILPEIESNLRNSTRIVKKLTNYVKNQHPVEYSKGRSKVLENLTEEEEGLFN